MKKWTTWLLLLVACKIPEQKEPANTVSMLSQGRWVDLTYSFSAETLYWPNNPTGFRLDTQFNGITPAGFYYSSNAYSSPEHGGTHLDAPVHFSQGKHSVDQVPLESLTGEAVVIDVTEKIQENADYQASVHDVEAWEKKHGRLPDKCILLFRTGWGRFYPDAEKYLGTREKGQEAEWWKPHQDGWPIQKQ